MSAPNAPLASLPGSPPGLPPGAPGRAAAATSGGGAVDFASLLSPSLPTEGIFAALQEMRALRDAISDDGEMADAADDADIGALLAEITQPLAPTSIPLSPVAVTATRLDPGHRAPEATSEGASPLRASAGLDDPAGLAALGIGETMAEPTESLASDTGRPAFRLPDPAPAALAHASLHANPLAAAQAAGTAGSSADLFVAPSIHSPQWASEVGQGLVWMVRNEVQTAQLSINPPQLGPIEITLSLGKDQATAHFASPHADVREILQEAIPRLREVLEGAGVQLGQADVSAQSQQQFAQRDNRPRGTPPEFGLEHATFPGTDAVNEAGPARVRRGNGLVDTFV